MNKSKIQRFVFLLWVPALLLLWGCSRYPVRQALEAYAHKPGFELKVVHTDSLSSGGQLDQVLSHLKKVKEIYILRFDSTKGSAAENRRLCERIQRYVTHAHFQKVLDIESKSTIGLYLKKDGQGQNTQVIFLKSGGRHSLYVWAPESQDKD